MHLSIRAAGTVSALALSLGALAGPAVASPEVPKKPGACTQQQAQVDRAEAALERVTAVFERQQAKVKNEKAAKSEAATKGQARAAERRLENAKDDRAEAKKGKKAQQMRLAKAVERLATCEAELPEDPEQPES